MTDASFHIAYEDGERVNGVEARDTRAISPAPVSRVEVVVVAVPPLACGLVLQLLLVALVALACRRAPRAAVAPAK